MHVGWALEGRNFLLLNIFLTIDYIFPTSKKSPLDPHAGSQAQPAGLLAARQEGGRVAGKGKGKVACTETVCNVVVFFFFEKDKKYLCTKKKNPGRVS